MRLTIRVWTGLVAVLALWGAVMPKVMPHADPLGSAVLQAIALVILGAGPAFGLAVVISLVVWAWSPEK